MNKKKTKDNNKNNSVKIILTVLITIVGFAVLVVAGSNNGAFKEKPHHYTVAFPMFENTQKDDGASKAVYVKVNVQVPYKYKAKISKDSIESEAIDILKNTPFEVIDSKNGLEELKDKIKYSVTLPEEIDRDTEVAVYITDYSFGKYAEIENNKNKGNPNNERQDEIMKNIFQGLKDK